MASVVDGVEKLNELIDELEIDEKGYEDEDAKTVEVLSWKGEWVKHSFQKNIREIQFISSTAYEKELNKQQLENLANLYIYQAQYLMWGEDVKNASVAKMYLQLASALYAKFTEYFSTKRHADFIPEEYPFPNDETREQYIEACEMTSSYNAYEKFVQKRLASVTSEKEILDSELAKLTKLSEEAKTLELRIHHMEAKQEEFIEKGMKILDEMQGEKTDASETHRRTALKYNKKIDKLKAELVKQREKDDEGSTADRERIAKLRKDIGVLSKQMTKWTRHSRKLRKFITEATIPEEEQVQKEHQKWLNKEAVKCKGDKQKLHKLKIDASIKLKQDTNNACAIKRRNMAEGIFCAKHLVDLDEYCSKGGAHLLAQKINHPLLQASDEKEGTFIAKADYKEGDIVFDQMQPVAWMTVDETLCSACGHSLKDVPDEKKLACEGDCKGRMSGFYCSDECRKADAPAHKVLCTKSNEEDYQRLLAARNAVHSQASLDALVFALYYKIVLKFNALNLSLADDIVINKIIRIGHDDNMDPDIKFASSLNMLETQYDKAVAVARLNLIDPRHDFWLHVGLILGLKKIIIPTYSDRIIGSLRLEDGDTEEDIHNSKAIGAGVYAQVVLAPHECCPNLALESGVDGKGNLVVRFRALEDIKIGDRYSMAFVDSRQIDVNVRQGALLFRNIKCKCAQCTAQKAEKFTEAKQLRVIQKALIAAGKAYL